MTRFSFSPTMVLRLLLGIIAVLLTLHLISVAILALEGGMSGAAYWAVTYFGVDSEDSLSTAYSVVMLALVAILCAHLAVMARGTQRIGWAFLALVFVAMSWDEGATIHERVGYLVEDAGLSGPFAYGWLVIGIPAAVVLGAVAIVLLRSLPRRVLRRMVFAGAVFVTGAVGVEVFASSLVGAGMEHENPLMLLLTTLEEGLEMLGIALFFATLLSFRAEREAALGVRVLREPAGLEHDAESRAAAHRVASNDREAAAA